MSGSVLGECFRRTVRDNADAIAVRALSEESITTFAQLGDAVLAVRRSLAAARVECGAVVVAALGNTPLFFAVFTACMDERLALVPVSQVTDAELQVIVDESGASAVIIDRAANVSGAQERRLLESLRLLRLRDPIQPPRFGESVVLKLTSGSTSTPKAAIASEVSLLNDGRHIIDAMAIRANDANAVYIPLSHSYAIGNIVVPLLYQGTVAALCPPFSPSGFVRDVHEISATVFPGVPFMFNRMRSAGVDALPPALRLLVTAGASIDREDVAWFRDRLDRKVHSFYGSSETGGIAYDDTDGVGDMVHIGKPLPETTIELRLTSADGSARIFVAGNAVSTRYASRGVDEIQPGEFIDGGFLTPDLGRLDENGHLILTGRISPLINVAGRKVDPHEVEQCLLHVRGVSACAVLGVPCDTRGQELTAFVVSAAPDLSAIHLRTACAAILSAYKIPRRFIFLNYLPLTERGKIDRRALLELAGNVSTKG